MPDRPVGDELSAPRFSIELDDIADVEELELPDTFVVETPVLATGSEMRPRVVIEKQGVPSALDLELMAYLLDIEVPHEVEPPPWSAESRWKSLEEASVDESPTPPYRRP
jgi:hypothetical protein